MNDREGELLFYIELFIDEHGYSPSFGEIVENTSIKSTSNVRGLLANLEEYGYIKSKPGTARSIVLTRKEK